MKVMKEFRKLNDKDLDAKLVELRRELIKENAQVAMGTQIKNPGKLKQTKKNIARLLTIKNSKVDKKE